MSDPTPRSDRFVLRRAALLALLLAVTIAAGGAARRVAVPDPTPLRITGGNGAVALTAELDRSAVLRGSDGLVRMELVLRGAAGAQQAARVPTDLVVVLDRSGSMDGAPIATALAAVRELVAGLADGDRFALVSYASDARIDIPLEAASGAARERWERAISAIAADGGTNTAGGLDLGHALLAEAGHARAVPRLIVLSDGHANEGDYSLEGLRARAARARTGEYVLSAVGIGNGFDEAVMSALADAGTGNFYYLPDVEKLAGIFADEFAAARETVARALGVWIAPAAGVVVASAGGYPLESDGGGVRFHPGDLFAGQERRIWLTLHAPTSATGAVALGELSLDYSTPDGDRARVAAAQLPRLVCVLGEDEYYASFDSERYQRAELRESVGALKQRIAEKVAAGRQEEAVAELDAYQARSGSEQLRALGYAIPDQERAVDELRAQVSSPAASAPEVRARLGKELLESGRDDQRAGAKR